MRSQLVNAVQGILVCQALWTTLACQSEAVQSNVLYNAKNIIKTISEDREAVFKSGVGLWVTKHHYKQKLLKFGYHGTHISTSDQVVERFRKFHPTWIRRLKNWDAVTHIITFGTASIKTVTLTMIWATRIT